MVYERRSINSSVLSVAENKVDIPLFQSCDEIIFAGGGSHCLGNHSLGRLDVNLVFGTFKTVLNGSAAGELAEA